MKRLLPLLSRGWNTYLTYGIPTFTLAGALIGGGVGWQLEHYNSRAYRSFLVTGGVFYGGISGYIFGCVFGVFLPGFLCVLPIVTFNDYRTKRLKDRKRVM